jgi:hypothetical protein
MDQIIDNQINGNMYKTKLVIPSTQTDILPQQKLFLCGYAVLNRTVWYIINLLMPFKTFSTVQWSLIYDWLIATAMHVPRIVCVCYSIVNIAKCKQQVTELLLHMITIKFWKFDEYGDWLSSDSLLNSRLRLYRHFEYCLHEIFISWLHNYLLQS